MLSSIMIQGAKVYAIFSAPSALQIPPPMPSHYQDHDHFMGLTDEFESFNCYSPDGNFSVSGRRDGNPIKICHYYNKGYCKHGGICKFFYGQSMSDYNSNEFFDDQAAFSPGSLEKLELEITEILKSRRGNPISIASSPMIYYERYGRTVGLFKPKILAYDASRYMENRYDCNFPSPGPIFSGLKQIYLTFPSESTFTEDDVANYFSNFGPVHDVRIPCQQKRMFGFVTFQNSETFEAPLCYHSHHVEMDHDPHA
ncbi:putative transcription factor C3H family [Helianthus anomalus]